MAHPFIIDVLVHVATQRPDEYGALLERARAEDTEDDPSLAGDLLSAFVRIQIDPDLSAFHARAQIAADRLREMMGEVDDSATLQSAAALEAITGTRLDRHFDVRSSRCTSSRYRSPSRFYSRGIRRSAARSTAFRSVLA